MEIFRTITATGTAEQSVLLPSVVAAIMIVAGVVLENSLDQLNMDATVLAPMLFIGGWTLFARAVVRNRINVLTPQTMTPYIAAALIVVGVMAMKMLKGEGGVAVPDIVPKLMFVGGWLLLAFSIGRHPWIAFGSALLVFGSMMYALPLQRIKGVVDGPGMPMFVMAWAGMVYANSLG